MIEIRQIKLPVGHTDADLKRAIQKRLKDSSGFTYEISKRAIDSRKKDELKYVYHVLVSVKNEEKLLARLKNDRDISLYAPVVYRMPEPGHIPLKHRPVIIGAGPAGLFCGLMLARAGYRPWIIERGRDVDSRAADVENFWETGVLNPNSNVQFGEGGAGTFSDGKLNTLVKDKFGRNRKVLELFVEHGAPKEILIESKPHIGTDKLKQVIKSIREEFLRLGGKISFSTLLKDISAAPFADNEDGFRSRVSSITIETSQGETREIPVQVLVLALGHSARDTFAMLDRRGLPMEPKAFSIGLRVEHDREMIQRAQYGDSEEAMRLPSASYKLTYQAQDGRGVFSFCMCPGGYVVNASSEPSMLAVNGMSNHDRMAKNSNSAIIVTVTPEDFGGSGALAGVEFQRKWERAAYDCGAGRVPVQCFGDLCAGRATTAFGSLTPNIKGQYQMADLNNCLPDYVIRDIIEGIHDFDKKLHGFANADTILAGIESRTSSPLRILRGGDFESEIRGIYPCGEGAGYAGGITSAAMDGIKVFEAIVKKYNY